METGTRESSKITNFMAKVLILAIKGLYFWSNGSEYKGEFKFNKMEGKGKWKSKLGDKYEGDFNNNLKEGWGVYSWRNGKVYEGEFVKGFQKKNHNHEEKAFKYEKIETKRRS
jgi:hypothetical protein